jgi:hypothetical protein
MTLLEKVKKAEKYLSDQEIEELVVELEFEYNRRYLKSKRKEKNDRN